KINLIPFNEHEGAPYKRPSKEKIHGFLKILLDRNMTAIIRKSKGDDISAACGQLKAKQLN
ncbi:MAG: 23S rRNA (adenine(2503)-C(2))-methyltransferase RlmN, partial [Desulfobacterales bacterium]|nr:23S rRNA (adenine(2503)-C(2))-methyltransferase RlmN [Desulfobacterales bacterium]